MSIKTIHNKIVNINKTNVLSSTELILKSNKDLRLGGTGNDNVEWWSYPENNHYFRSENGFEPTLNTTEKAIEFEAANSQHLIGSKVFDTTRVFTLSVWIKSKAADTLYRIISNFVSSVDNGFQLNKATGSYVFSLYSGGSQGTSRMNIDYAPSNDTNWHHILGVYDGSTFSTYIDGHARSVFSITTTISATEGIWIGKLNYFAGQPFDGYIDDFSIKHSFDEKLVNYTGSVIKYAAGEEVFIPNPRSLDKTPILQLQSNVINNQKILLDESNNVMQWNDVRNKRFFTSTNNPLYDFTEQSIYFEQAAATYLKDIKNDNYYNFGTADFYFLLWIKPDVVNLTENLFGNFNSSIGILLQKRTGSNLRFYAMSFSAYSSESYLLTSEWNNIVIQRHDSILYMILNGILVYKTVNTIDIFCNSELELGSYTGSKTQNLNGYIDGFIVANSALLENISSNSVGDKVFTPKTRNFPIL